MPPDSVAGTSGWGWGGDYVDVTIPDFGATDNLLLESATDALLLETADDLLLE